MIDSLMPLFKAGLPSLLGFQLVVALLLYFVPLPFLSNAPSIVIVPTEQALWTLFGIPVALRVQEVHRRRAGSAGAAKKAMNDLGRTA